MPTAKRTGDGKIRKRKTRFKTVPAKKSASTPEAFPVFSQGLARRREAPSVLSAFVTLFVTIGPVDTAAIFASVTAEVHRPDRFRLAARSIAIAGLVLLLFAVAGQLLLSLLHISMPAFRVAGGILLLLQALALVFSSPGLSSISEPEKRDARRPSDIAVFPLAFPLIAGPARCRRSSC